MDKFPNSADSITIDLTGHSSDNDDNSPPLSTEKEVSKAVKRKAAEVDSDEEFEFGEEEAGNRGGGKRRVLEESDEEEEEEEMKVEEEKRVEKGKSKIQLMKEKKDVEKEEEGNKLFSIFTSKKVSSSTTMSTSLSALPPITASSSPALSIPGAGFANGAMQPCWCDNKGCDGNVKRWPCTNQCCKRARTLHPCKEMKWTKKSSGKVQAYKTCKTKRAANAVTNARWNPINNPINSPIYAPLRHAAERAEATARKMQEEAIRLPANVPKPTENELKRIVLDTVKAPLLAAALEMATFVYVFTASRDRRDKEAMRVFKSGKSSTSPLQSRSSPSSPLRDLSSSEIKDLNLQIYDVFGFDQYASDAINEANMEGFCYTAVARVEALVHIHLWKHKARAWQKVGGDHAKGRTPLDGVVDTSRRVVRIILSTEPLPPNFVWNVDHTTECAQKWSSGA